MKKQKLTYDKAGVNIDVADATKRQMANSIDSGDARMLNRLGAFASLVEGRFKQYRHPILVLKMEEPGSKQKLAFRFGRVTSIAHDLINHLINDIIVMGAEPLYVLDCIVCGKIEPEIVTTLVSAMSSACHQQGCVLVGGETSEQPGVVDRGLYILSASIIGIAEKERIIDGSNITEDDTVLAVASNGLHTNGYSLVRAIIEKKPEVLQREIDGESFLDIIMRPHMCYFQELRELIRLPGIKGIAHITGGGIEGNLQRILPSSVDAHIDRSQLRPHKIFKVIRDEGGVTDREMLRTFNMGVGMTIVCSPDIANKVITDLGRKNCCCYPIGNIAKGTGVVKYRGHLNNW